MVAVLLSVLFAWLQPCKPCDGKGWVLEYAIGYEVADPHQSTCVSCRGKGWNIRTGAK